MSIEPQSVVDAAIINPGTAGSKTEEVLTKLDDRLDRWSDMLNPILVKETRQALKSRQFLTTFFLLLICAWGWSLLAIAIQTTNSTSEFGRATLTGYFIVLVLPMILIVPFTAFRSLAREREDGTHELLSITTLGARQIIMGKLGSAMLQMMLFYSILAPCIAFTYLLRGVDVIVIAMLLWYTLLNSVILSSLGLLLAAAARTNHSQVMLSLLLLGALAVSGFAWGIMGGGIIWELDIDPNGAFFWHAHAMTNVMAICFIVLFLQGAAAQISFASDNRSTKPRITMLVQTTLFIAWTTAFLLSVSYDDAAFMSCTALAIYWAVMGALLVGEIGTLSPRVRRSLPQTGLGRTMFTWLAPGGGTGYLMTVCASGAGLLVLCIAYMLNDRINNDAPIWFALLLFLYIVSYIGAARLILSATSRWSQPGPLGSFVVTVTLLVFGAVLPSAAQLLAYRVFGDDYTILQAPNWMWSLMEAARPDVAEIIGTTIIVGGAAAVIMLTNLLATAREINQYHVAAPRRVREEEAAERPKVEVKPTTHPLDVQDEPET